jgi:hypothetical protein
LIVNNYNYIDEGIMVVPERQTCIVAVQIKDRVSIDISEEVALAPLEVNEPLNLYNLLSNECECTS